MMDLFPRSFKDILLYILQATVLIVLLIWTNHYWYSSYYTCRSGVVNDYAGDTDEDILSDIIYAQTLTMGLPFSRPIQLNQDQKNQMLQYQKQAAVRSKVLTEETSLALVQKAYVPQLICPTIMCVGPIKDSGYFLCNPWVLGQPGERCILYSMGIRGLIEFERDFYKVTNQQCDIFCFDEHDEEQQIFEPFRGTYTRATISYKTDPDARRYSIMDLMKKFGHSRLDVLKLDIDGGEHSALPTFLRQFNGTVCQIVMELHANTYGDGKWWLSMARMLERRGYRLFYSESFIHNSRHVMYSYIHLKCFEKFGLSLQSVLFTYFV